ncbi:MAG TPA: PAS domain-containing protein [Candidatus Marinimicrobia bacterium]|nr:PAS domain-containing protein [Candidatus Neomarinimicrobiota bacterium]HRS52281.1 PAS domain-containing protein [Candidatus Neomarinimicrobiota bacterium]HRU91970.1 PAS domain-containing protein [Candidatus Neomarinimicrobiota bacterium]
MNELKVLIAESNPETIKNIRAVVNNLGYQVIEIVDNGTSAVKKAIELKPDLALIGLSLKGELDGIETSAQIRQNLDIPTVFIIKQSEQLDLEKFKQANANGYLFEPFTIEQVRFVIELALSNLKSEQNSIKRQALLSTTLKSIGDAVITTDEKGLIAFLNPVAEKLTGWSSQEATGKPLLEVFNIINESTGKKPPNPIKRILDKGLVIELANHTVLISRNGQKIPIDDSGAPIKDEFGNILGAVLVFRDITEQRRAKKDLEYEKSLLDALMNNIPDSIYFKDRKCRLLRINRGMMKSLNMTQESEYYLKTDIDLFGEEFGRETVKADLHLMETGEPIVGMIESRKLADGSLNWTSTTKAPILDAKDNVIGLVGVTRTINDIKRVEEAMRYEKSLLDALMNNIPDSIYFKDRQCRLIRVSRKMMQDLGYKDVSQILGKTDVDLFGEEFGRQTMETDLQLMATGKPIIGLVESRKLSDGKTNWTLTTKVPLRDQDNQIIGLVGITREINEIKQAEEQREKIIAELQEALDKIKTLKGLIPICASCKKIRDDQGYWNNVESYIKEHAEVEFTHGICPDCMKKLYPNYYKEGSDNKET